MNRRLWVAVAAAAAVAAVIGLWAGVQSSGSGDDAPDRTDNAPASTPDPDYWNSERMQDATPAPMPTVD